MEGLRHEMVQRLIESADRGAGMLEPAVFATDLTRDEAGFLRGDDLVGGSARRRFAGQVEDAGIAATNFDLRSVDDAKIFVRHPQGAGFALAGGLAFLSGYVSECGTVYFWGMSATPIYALKTPH
jgi:hypothetical protein